MCRANFILASWCKSHLRLAPPQNGTQSVTGCCKANVLALSIFPVKTLYQRVLPQSARVRGERRGIRKPKLGLERS
jgi:hypothetical protein